MHNPTVGSSATRADSRRLRLSFQTGSLALAESARWQPAAVPLPRSCLSSLRFTRLYIHHVLSAPKQIAIAVKCSDHVGTLRGFLPWGLQDACPLASGRVHVRTDQGRRPTTLNMKRRSISLSESSTIFPSMFQFARLRITIRSKRPSKGHRRSSVVAPLEPLPPPQCQAIGSG